MGSKKILIIEDDADLVAALRTALESVGYTVDWAANGKEARQRVRKARPDLAVIDIMLDTVSEGVQIVQEFRRDKNLKDMPIIMLTAINQKLPFSIGPELEEGYLPVNRFIEKPVDPVQLLKEIAALIG
jgi:CheY-like chemotaxis protein